MTGKDRCGDYNQMLSAYLDGEVTPAERTELLQHLAVCADCRARLEEYRAIGTRLRGLPPVTVPDSLTASIYMQTVDAPPRRLQILTNRFAYPAAAIAAVLLVFIVAAFLLVDGYQRRIDPTIVGSSPGNEAVWRINEPIRITFNKEMNKESVESALAIIPTSESDLQKTWEGNTLIIGQNRLLKPGTSYRISITTEARDKWGNRLSDPFSVGFSTTTNVAIDEPAPTQEPTSTPSPDVAVVAPSTPTPGTQKPDKTPTPTPRPASTNTPEPAATATPENRPGSGNQDPPSQPDTPQQPQQPEQPEQSEQPPAVDPTPTVTPLPPQPTQTAVPDPTATPTEVPPTETPVPEPTATPEPEPEPSPTQEVPVATPTEEPVLTPTPDGVAITGSFANVYWRNEAVRIGLGEATAVEQPVSVEELDFQHGKMLHNLATGEIIMMLTNGFWEFVWNTAEGELPEFTIDEESGLWEPGGVFGYVWQSDPYIAESLGMAVAGDVTSYQSTSQAFEGGKMYYSVDGFIYVLYDTAYWELYPDAGPLTDDDE